MELFDSHCHLDDNKFLEETEEIIKNANNNNVKYMTTIGINELSSIEAVKIAKSHDNIYATIGLYPEYCNDDEVDLSFIKNIIEEYGMEKIVAIGEIGLDYHRDDTNKENQIKHFIRQINLANELNLPIVIHSRDADMDMLEVLKSNRVNKGFLMHCFSSSLEIAKEIVKLRRFYFYFSELLLLKMQKILLKWQNLFH